MKAPPPLRFLGAVVGLWACFRVAALAPDWGGAVEAADHGPGAAVAAASAPEAIRARALAISSPHPPSPCRSCRARSGRMVLASVVPRSELETRPSTPLGTNEIGGLPALQPRAAAPVNAQQTLRLEPPPILIAQAPSRWSGSAWAFARRGEGRALAAGGMLGGSQMGGRLSYRLNGDVRRPVSLSARLYSPLNSRRAAEAALGVQWQPVARLPVRVLAERRQALGPEGRSAFSLLAHGGVSDLKLLGPLHLNAYGQAGVVGLRSRDLFADGGARIETPFGMARVGAGVWGAAQPGLSRLDVGPSASLLVPAAGRNLRLSLDWRMSVAGNASPRSGPALTLGTDF